MNTKQESQTKTSTAENTRLEQKIDFFREVYKSLFENINFLNKVGLYDIQFNVSNDLVWGKSLTEKMLKNFVSFRIGNSFYKGSVVHRDERVDRGCKRDSGEYFFRLQKFVDDKLHAELHLNDFNAVILLIFSGKQDL